MAKPRKTLGDRMLLFSFRHCVVGEVDGIGLVDLRNGEHLDSFRRTIEQSLQLIRQRDPRRYARITRHIRWIVNQVTGSGCTSEYNERILACSIEFTPMPDVDPRELAAAYGCLLVDAATHGLIASRGIKYAPEDLGRIERLCTAEQSRLVDRLDFCSYRSHGLRADPTSWERVWTRGRWKLGLSFLSRSRRDSEAEPTAPPNGGPAMPVGNSGVREGPPSVS
jgi:hypothetical protein